MVNGVTTSFAYAPGNNQLVSASGGISATYGYDPNGNTMTIDNHTAYVYDPFDRLINAGGADFVLSAEGQRLEKTSAGGTTYFAPSAGGALLAEDQNGTWMDYVWLNGRLVSVIANGGVYPVATDQTGRPVALTAPTSHAILWSTQTLPFGGGTVTNHWGGFNLGFPASTTIRKTGCGTTAIVTMTRALAGISRVTPLGWRVV